MKLNKKGPRWLLISGIVATISLVLGASAKSGPKSGLRVISLDNAAEFQECLDQCFADALECISDWEQCMADIEDYSYCNAMYPCQYEAYECIDDCSSEL